MWTTADLCDKYSPDPSVQIAGSALIQYGEKNKFFGQISTIKTFEDNVLVRECLNTRISNRVLVIDGGGSKHCALLGDNLAKLAKKNGWQGLIINGCIRDSAELANINIGILALASHPLKSNKKRAGELDINISFTGIHFYPNHHVYVDKDGIIVSKTALLNAKGKIIKNC